MSTRFYFQTYTHENTMVPFPTLQVSASWTYPGTGEPSCGWRSTCSTTRQGTYAASAPYYYSTTATQSVVLYQFQSEPLMQDYTFNTGLDTVSMVLPVIQSTGTADTHLAFILRVVDSAGSIRGTLLSYLNTSTEFPYDEWKTRIHNARYVTSNIAAQVGDRFVMEIGLYAVTPGSGDNAWIDVWERDMGSSPARDYNLAADQTETDPYPLPWWELSATLEIGSPRSAIDVSSGQARGQSEIVTPSTYRKLSGRYYHAGVEDNRASSFINGNPNQQLLYARPFAVPGGGVIESLGIYCSSGYSGAAALLGVYEATSATNLYPYSLLLSGGEVPLTGVGWKSVTLRLWVDGSRLYYAVVLFNAAATYAQVTAGPYYCGCGMLGMNIDAPSDASSPYMAFGATYYSSWALPSTFSTISPIRFSPGVALEYQIR